MLFIASQLTYLAFVANFGTLLTVVFVLAAMILFIRQFRLYEFEPVSSSSVVRVKNPVGERLLTKVELPFSLTIEKNHFDSLTGENTLTVISKSLCPCLFVVLLDIPAEELTSLMNQPWVAFKDFLGIGVKLWTNLKMHSFEGPHNSKSFSISCPARELPRSSYAIVTFHVRSDDQSLSDQDPAAVITLLHLPDRYCSAPALTLCQYLKFKGGRVLNLKPLYSSASGEEQKSITKEVYEGNTNCVICWSNPALWAILPCRHVCLCGSCRERVETCPVCRSRVLSYFSV